MKQLTSHATADYVLHLAWDTEGTRLAVTPATGDVHVLSLLENSTSTRAGQALGNGESAWFQGDLVTSGFDGVVRFTDGSDVRGGKEFIERLKVNSDGTLLGVAQGRFLHVMDAEHNAEFSLRSLPASVSDFAWNPTNPKEVAVVGAGGARMWRLGENQPYAQFDWGGASMQAVWSPDGRWLVTGDQTPSVHIYDFTRSYPLHIQGYDARVSTIAFTSDSTRVATSAGEVITVWPTTGEKGPEGATPLQMDGPQGGTTAAAFSRASGQLAVGDDAGVLLIYTLEGQRVLRKMHRRESGIGCLAWHPSQAILAVGHADGSCALLDLD